MLHGYTSWCYTTKEFGLCSIEEGCLWSEASTYGLEQYVCAILFKLGFKRLYTDISVFMHGTGQDTIIISVHVEDTNIMSASLPRVLWLTSHLQKEFGIVDDGPTSYFLEIEVAQDMEG